MRSALPPLPFILAGDQNKPSEWRSGNNSKSVAATVRGIEEKAGMGAQPRAPKRRSREAGRLCCCVRLQQRRRLLRQRPHPHGARPGCHDRRGRRARHRRLQLGSSGEQLAIQQPLLRRCQVAVDAVTRDGGSQRAALSNLQRMSRASMDRER